MTQQERRAEIDAYFMAMGIDNVKAIDRLTSMPGGYHTLHDIVAYPPMLRDWGNMGFRPEEQRILVVRLPCTVDPDGIIARFVIEDSERMRAEARQLQTKLEQLRAENERLNKCVVCKRNAGKNKRVNTIS